MAGYVPPEERKGKPLQIVLEEDTHARFKMMCSSQGLKMTLVIKELIDQWLLEEAKKKPWMKKP